MRLISSSLLTGSVSTLLLAFVLSGVAQPAETDDPAREIATTIRQTESRARTLKTQIDEILRNLERPGAQARGSVLGWERLLKELRAEAGQAGQLLSWQGSASGAVAALKLVDEKEVEGTRRRLRELDRRLQRLNETIARTERSLQQLQREMQEPDTPPAAEQATTPQPKTTPQAAEKVKKELDLSGTWLVGEEEWHVKHNPQQGTITILDPIKHLPGRYVEYSGTVKGRTITASYQATDPAVFNPKLPEKVRNEHAKDRVRWTLKLQVTKEGKLEGAKQAYTVSWNKKTLKITRVTPKKEDVLLAKKESQPVMATPAKPTVEKKKPTRKGPPEPEIDDAMMHEFWRIVARLKESAVEALKVAQEQTRRVEEAPRRAEEARRRAEEVRKIDEERATRHEREAKRGRDRYEDLEGIRRGAESRLKELGFYSLSRPERKQLLLQNREAQQDFDEFARALSEQLKNLRDIREFEERAKAARARIAEAEQEARAAERDLRRLEELEREADEAWERYDEAQQAYLRAKDQAQRAAQERAQSRRRASP